MTYIWISSNFTHGRMIEVEDTISALDAACQYGRGEDGEIVHVWHTDDTTRKPDGAVGWDSQLRTYKPYDVII